MSEPIEGPIPETAQKKEAGRSAPAASMDGNPLPQGRGRWLAAGTAALVLAVLIGLVLSRRPARFSEEKGSPPHASGGSPTAASPTGTVKFLMEQQWLIRLKLAQAEPHVVARQITSTGRVIPAAHHRALVAPPVAGLIADGNLPRVGQQVARGQVLAVLRQMPTAAETAQIHAGQIQLRLESARIDAERRRLGQLAGEMQVRLNQARAEYERARRLYERKAYALRQLQAAEADYQAAQASYDSAVEQLDALSDAPTGPPGGLGAQTNYRVRAPISGTVVKVHKAMGEQVAPGEPIVEIIDLDTVWVEAPIFEHDLHHLGQRVEAVFATPAHPGREYRGTLIDLGAVIDEQSRAATVTFEVPNPDRTLRIGMQANVRIEAGEQVPAMLIPKEAVLENEGKRIVYILLSGEEFQRREVTLGDEYGDRVAVLSGLRAGERVVTQGAYQLKLQELRPANAGAHTHET